MLFAPLILGEAEASRCGHGRTQGTPRSANTSLARHAAVIEAMIVSSCSGRAEHMREPPPRQSVHDTGFTEVAGDLLEPQPERIV